MQVPVVNAAGKEVGMKTILADVERSFRARELLHQAVVTAEANARIPIAHTKTRGEVSGGGRKPWRQKGTGRARAGSTRSPLWKGGGVSFGPRSERTFQKRFPARMRRAALAQALVAKAAAGELVFLEHVPESRKTVAWASALQGVRRAGSVLLAVSPSSAAGAAQGARNIPGVRIVGAHELTAADILSVRSVVCSPGSWDVLEERVKKF